MKYAEGEKYLWHLPEEFGVEVLDVAASYNLSVPIVHTLFSRGFQTKDQIDSFLFSSFEKDVADSNLLKDANKALDRIERAIKDKEKILIFGDYDVDGMTSTSLMLSSLIPLGANINFVLPNREKDGYGLSKKIIERCAQNNYKLIITVDNGITAIEPVLYAKQLGLDVIITDHHRPHDNVPDAIAVVNPAQEDCAYPYKSFAGVGVTFKLMSMLYARNKKTLPIKVYELMLLGTIADVVPLTGENRFWVRHCLNFVNKNSSLAFDVLRKNGQIAKPFISSTDIGFGIAPQLNALGRLEDPRKSVKFLIGSDETEIHNIGQILFEMNQARKQVERSIYDQIVEKINQGEIDLSKENIIIAASDKWPAGVIGLVASRLVSTYGKPALLFHLTKDGFAKGSCRSISEFNIFNALAKNKDLLKSFGGHSFAAGLSLKVENLRLLKDSLERIIADELTEMDLRQKIKLDAVVQMPEITKKIVDDLQHLEPFGQENRAPNFYLKDVSLVQKPKMMKDLHVKCSIFADGVIKPVVFFNRPELYELFMAQEQESFDLAVNISENHWNNNISVELLGLDVAFKKKD
ncbi:MAG: Exonuclease RecJ [candidate division TM6 bacterium GW2011_GWF2_32_72]|nr:MAG: Exonuclease RecJ [candidate division TM6 bacterium GW2011_GWF2_32_72]